jgi:glycine/D-amino acid oxidase-like deaminating enzyme
VRLNAKRNRCRPCAAPTVGVLRRPPQAGKIADDTRGPLIDPSTMERVVSEGKLSAAQAYLRMRFPQWQALRYLKTEFANMKTPQTTISFWIAIRKQRTPRIVGGGSGHGFKHGPTIGEIVADAVLGSKAPPTELRGRNITVNAVAPGPVPTSCS